MSRNKKQIVLNPQLVSLIGFAKKSRNLDSGFEAVRRGILKNKIAVVLLDDLLGESSFKKILSLSRRNKIPLIIVKESAVTKRLSEVTGNKIVGFRHGSLATGFLEKLKQEYRWL